jgi:voltage-gated potassium channel
MKHHRHPILDLLQGRLTRALALFGTTWLAGGVGFWVIGQAFGMNTSPMLPDGTADLQNYGVLNCLYMSAMTVSTLGMGDLGMFNRLPPEGREVVYTYTIAFSLLSYLLVVYASAQIVGYVVEGALGRYLERRRMERNLEETRNHHVVVGLGTTGRHIVEELVKLGREVVGVDTAPETVAVLRKQFPDEIFLEGDGTADETLERAGIRRAAGLFSATPLDKDNIITVLTARQMNPKVRVVARTSALTNVAKLKQVGADATISPNHIGGLRMASEMLRPVTTTFLDTMLRSQKGNTRFDEVTVSPTGPSAGRSLKSLDLQARLGLVVVALVRRGGDIQYNPPMDSVVEGGDSLVAIVTPEQKASMDRALNQV